MRQFVAIFLSIGALAAFGQTPAASLETTANKRIDLAKEELGRVEQLVEAGALPRIRLEEAQRNVEDAQDEPILARPLSGHLPVDKVNDPLMDEMVAAAQRRVERAQIQLAQAQKLVTD